MSLNPKLITPPSPASELEHVELTSPSFLPRLPSRPVAPSFESSRPTLSVKTPRPDQEEGPEAQHLLELRLREWRERRPWTRTRRMSMGEAYISET